jgi:hypothetical protein
MNKSVVGTIIILVSIVFFACTSDKKHIIDERISIEYSTNIEDILLKQNKDTTYVNWINEHTFFEEKNENFCSKINQKAPYGIGASFSIPSELWHANFELTVQSKLMKNGDAPSFSLIVQLEQDDSLIFWQGNNLDSKIQDINTWETVGHSIKLPRSFARKDMRVKLYFMNNDNVNTFVDDLKIQLTSFKTPTYLPKLSRNSTDCTHDQSQNIENKHYSLTICNNGHVQVLDKKGEMILDGLKYLIEYKLENDTLSHTYTTASFELKEVNETNVVLSSLNANSEIEIIIKSTDNTRHLAFTTETTFLDSVKLLREALVFNYVGALQEVYKKNRTVDRDNFEDEYWLEKQGCKIGVNENSFYVYHQQNISSLQLDTKHKQLIINLDYAKDHPLLHFPLMEKASNTFEDISYNSYSENNVRQNNFTFSIGIDNAFFPRILRTPNGFLATYVFTEHADNTDIKTHRATYFGSSKIKEAKNAIGGFIKHNIPVTKSVFYDNAENVMNSEKGKSIEFNSPIASIKHTPGFSDFLADIHKNNIDICLHTPDQHTTTKEKLIEAAQFVNKNYQSPSWIDHGYDNGISNNREDIVCDGLNKNSQYYSLDVLKKNKVKYFWNCYFEDVHPFKEFRFYSSISAPYVGFGNAFPTPYYWQHASKAPGVYFWPTYSLLEPGNKWEYLFNEQRLKDFIDNYSVEFNHCYPAWISEDKGFWKFGTEGELLVNPHFDKALKTLSDKRDKGLINLTTVKDILDYWTTTEEVSIENVGKNEFLITNNSNKKIDGFSIAVQSEMVRVNNEIPNHKFFSNDLVCWFDLAPSEKKILTLISNKN